MKLAQGKRKQAGRKTAARPITAHPLFPAIVALWFGALFGLGSLAIRPALLEALVLKLQLDLVIPAAAPPLGMTARILLSLGMALAGGCLGAVIARRIARPKPEVRERRRGAVVSMREAQQPSVVEAPASRRRTLAVEEDYQPSYHHEYAPLPGGVPQILDVSEFDFAQEDPVKPVVAPAPPASEPTASAPVESAPLAAGALDLSGFLAGEPLAVEAAAPARGFDMPAEAPVLARFDAPASAPAQSFAPPTAAASAPAQSFAAPMAPAAPAFAPPPFLAPLGAVDPVEAAVPEAVPAEVEPVPSAMPASGLGDAVEPVAEDCQHEDETVDQIHAAALEALSQVELIERLARALQRRRALAGSTSPAAYVPPVAMEPDVSEPVPQSASAAVEFTPEPNPFVQPEPAVMAEPVAQAPAFAAPFAAPAEPQTLAAEPIVPPQIAMPAALRPVGLELHHDDDDDDLAAFLPPRQFAMPSPVATPAPAPAPTPAAFAAPFEQAAAAAEPLLPEASAPFAPPAPEPVAEPEEDVLADGYSSLLDLSRPAPLRTGFVRIEEPVEEVAAPEPVVVFPGQAQRFAAAQPASAAALTTPSAPAAAIAAPTEGAGPLRRFDAPASTVPGAQPISAASPVVQDREEAERALRTALATLQRMSATG